MDCSSGPKIRRGYGRGQVWELRRLRAEANQLGASHYVIPSRGPFAYVSCPHYTFELLTWVGYALHSGLDGTSLLPNLQTRPGCD